MLKQRTTRHILLMAPITLNLSAGLEKRLDEISAVTSYSKEDIMKRAIALFDVVHTTAGKSPRIGIIGTDQKIVTEIVGL